MGWYISSAPAPAPAAAAAESSNQHSAGSYFFLRGTFAPFARASDNPMAMACFRDVTFRPLPLFSVPRFRRRMALSTRFEAAFPYFRLLLRRRAPVVRARVRRRAAILTPGKGLPARYVTGPHEQFSGRVNRDPASRVMADAPIGAGCQIAPRAAEMCSREECRHPVLTPKLHHVVTTSGHGTGIPLRPGSARPPNEERARRHRQAQCARIGAGLQARAFFLPTLHAERRVPIAAAPSPCASDCTLLERQHAALRSRNQHAARC